MTDETVHARLKRARKMHYPSAAKAADGIGVPRPTYYNYEAGHRHLDYEAMTKVVTAFGISAHWLLTGRHWHPPAPPRRP